MTLKGVGVFKCFHLVQNLTNILTKCVQGSWWVSNMDTFDTMELGNEPLKAAH